MNLSPEFILAIILIILSLSFVFDQLLDYINLRSQRADIPTEIEGFYDRSKYLQSLDYHKELTYFSFLTSTFSFLLSVAMLVFGGFGWLDEVLRGYIQNEILLALAFFGVLMVASDIFTIPFQWYSTFVIEEKYGFNKTTPKLFIVDKLKGYLLSALIGGPLIAVLIYLIHFIGPDFWIWFALIAAGFMLLANMFYTSLILPLFNKLTPLPDGELNLHPFQMGN
jgi:STE24 endopeptidase